MLTTRTRSYVQNSSVEHDSTLELTYQRSKIGHETDMIGQFQHNAKFYAWILFIELGPDWPAMTSYHVIVHIWF